MLTILQGFTLALFVVVAPLLFWVGSTHARRRMADRGAQRATRAFAAFWLVLSFDALLGALQLLVGSTGLASGTFLAVVQIAIYASVAVMMTGLLHYLIYLFTGREWVLWPVAAFYALVFLQGLQMTLASRPIGFRMTRWTGVVTYATPPTRVGAVVLGVAFLLPPILGALAYGAFVFKVKGATQRYRVALVSLGIFVWFLTSLVIQLKTIEDSDALQASGRLITLASILVVVAAYHPPGRVRRRYGIEPLVPTQPMVADVDRIRARRAARTARLAARLRDLV
jgi:hypothetical protein